MRIDISGLYDVVQAVVDYLKSVSVVLGSHTISLWAFVLALGTMESINFILGLKGHKDDD